MRITFSIYSTVRAQVLGWLKENGTITIIGPGDVVVRDAKMPSHMKAVFVRQPIDMLGERKRLVRNTHHRCVIYRSIAAAQDASATEIVTPFAGDGAIGDVACVSSVSWQCVRNAVSRSIRCHDSL
jgi:hypothetical protein